jgi:transposase
MTLLTLTNRECSALHDFILQAPTAQELRRAQALLWLGTGDSVDEVAEHLQISPRTVYNWVHRFQQRADLDLRQRLADAPRSGRPPVALGIIDPLLAEVIDQDPRTLGYGSTVWTALLLQHYLRDVHDITVSRKSVSRAIDRLALRWKRPRHALANRPDTWRQAKGGSNTGFCSGRAPCC